MLKIAPKNIIPLRQVPNQPSPEQLAIGPDAEPDPTQGQPPDDGDQYGDDSPGSVDPSIAGYMGPEYGPFMCQHCVHFLQPNACHVVAGNIDPQGCCNMYTPPSEGSPQEEAQESPEQEAAEQAAGGNQ